MIPVANPLVRRSILAALGCLGVLILGGLATEHLRRPSVATKTVTETKSASTAEAFLLQVMQEEKTRRMELESRISQAERRQNDVSTRTVERIERYLPSPAVAAPGTPGGNPVVVIPGSPVPPQPLPAPQRDPVEIVTRTIEALDRSRTEANSTTESRAVETASTSTETVTAKAETKTESTETKTETESKPATGGADPKLGGGVTSAGQPFASYDLATAPLGPRAVGWGKVGAGVFVTRSATHGVDGGPQINLTPGKGRIFVGAGYAVREKQSRLMIGMKF